VKKKTNLFDVTEVIIKLLGETYVFDVKDSLDLQGADIEALLKNHSEEYHKWRMVRDKIKALLRKKRFAYDCDYGDSFFTAYMQLSRSSQVNKSLIDGYLIGKAKFVKMQKEIQYLEDRLDKLDTIIYSLEHRKHMIHLLVTNIGCQ